MSDIKFTIGIGSQRAGSTLLHRILDECTEIFMHPIKELHYFDTLFGVRNPDYLVNFSQSQLDREFDRLISMNDHSYIGEKKYKCYLRANWILASRPIENVEYVDLYRPCLIDNHYFGEITPEYMILPDEGIESMADKVGRDAPIILLSRDPVERFISSFKLLKLYRAEDNVIENFDFELQKTLSEMPTWVEQQRQLNDYESALRNYKKYFNNICFIKYEDLISNKKQTIDKLEVCLGTPVNRSRAESIMRRKVNQIGETGYVSRQAIKLLSKKFEQEIEYLQSIE